MFVQENAKTHTIAVFDTKHQLGVIVQRRGATSHIRLNPPVHQGLRFSFLYFPSSGWPCTGVPHYSPLSERSMRLRKASWGDTENCSMPYICSAIGISTVQRRARSTAADVVLMPSATIRIEATISASLRPLASSSPTLR